MNFNNYTLFIFSLIIILLSVNNIKYRIQRGLLLSAVTGLHSTILLFFGVGPLFYSIFGLPYERMNPFQINEAINKVSPYFFLGQIAVSVIEFRDREKKSDFNVRLVYFLKERVNLNNFNIFILSISFIASVVPVGNIAASGIGTLFPLISGFLLPAVILVTFKFNVKDKTSLLVMVGLIVTVGYQAFTSAWRSQLILFCGSILMGLNLRGKINLYLIGCVTVLMIFVVLPFQQSKKLSNQAEFDTNKAFVNSLNVSYQDRLLISTSFFAERINYIRELGYVQNAIDNKQINLRDGESYFEVIYQLIPRIFWDNKPSYNKFTGREIPRKIGLVSSYDQNTSWGVNCFAEYVYNFSYETLPVFILFIYFIFSYFDSLTIRLKIHPQYTWLLQATLFFLSLNLVSVIFSSTYFLWSFLTIIVLNSTNIGQKEIA